MVFYIWLEKHHFPPFQKTKRKCYLRTNILYLHEILFRAKYYFMQNII